MKIYISLSADTYVKGDRVAFKAKKDEWYVGTVTSVRKGNVGILFDDGIKGDPSKPSSRTWKKIATVKKYKKPLTDSEVAALPSYSDTLKTKISKRTTKPVEKVKPTSKLAPNVAHLEDKITAQEQHLRTSLGTLSAYGMCKDRPSQLKYLTNLWHLANRKFFANKLQPPGIRFQKDMGTSFRRRGAWFPRARVISISPRLFLGNEAHVITTMVHEMCHQAVSEIDRITIDKHGTPWATWMKHCGLTPSKYSAYDNENFFTEAEKAANQAALKNREAAKALVKKENIQQLYPRDMCPAQYHDPKSNLWVKGLIVGRHDLAGKRWNVVVDPYSRSWKIVPATWFYKLPESEQAKYNTPDYQKAAGLINTYKEEKRARTSQKRAYNAMLKTTYGSKF